MIAAVGDTARRIGQNEALFREVNDRIERVTESLQVQTDQIAILCECGDQTCTERIEISPAEYERVRGEPTSFFVCSGHEQLDFEDVIERHPRYSVVRKRKGPPADIARELDPRN
jgi:hypothetical protein